jgi:hypothetical protein
MYVIGSVVKDDKDMTYNRISNKSVKFDLKTRNKI